MMKQIIGRGHKSGGLYILDPIVPRPIACSGVTIPFETHCRLGHPSLPLLKKLCHPSLPLLKKLCPQFSSLSSLDGESYQFAKHHHLSSRPKVNNESVLLLSYSIQICEIHVQLCP